VGNFLRELKRRNVFRVGAAYVVTSWLIIQVIETIREPLGLPGWTEAFFIVLLAAGLPLALIFAWAFEITPEGLKKTREVDQAESVTSDTGRKLNYAIVGMLALALGYFAWDGYQRGNPPAATAGGAMPAAGQTPVAQASIAVLPFVNMSADPEQEYFSDGISEELLNLLAKIPDLRVPARTSSFQFKGQNLDISEVAKQLNVAHVLEGSVRKADVKIRVTAQLIEADTGYHLWSETYDRELTDVFQIQDEISAAIVESLSDTLGLEVRAAPKLKPAANPDAYNAYLLAQHLIKLRTKQDIEAAIPNYEKAIELDPNYAPAHAGLGLAWRLLLADGASYGTLKLDEMLDKALPHLEKALELDPKLPEALGAMGLTREAQDRFEEAVGYYERALALNPSQTDVRNWYSSALDTLGREEEALAQMEKAYELDPLSVLTLNNYANALTSRRHYDQAQPVIERLAQIDPPRGAMFRSVVLVNQHRKADGVVELLRGVDTDPGNLRTVSSAAFELADLGLANDAVQIWPYPNLQPIVSAVGDVEQALELARLNFEENPGNPENVSALAWAYWRIGQKSEALKNAQRYLDTVDPIRRPIDGTNWMFVVDAWQRRDDEALRRHVDPLEKDIDHAMETGIDGTYINFGKSIALFVRGDQERSLDYLDRALSQDVLRLAVLDAVFGQLGWKELPEYVERRREHIQYIEQERRKFLKVACGPDGFNFWQPSADTCTEVDTI